MHDELLILASAQACKTPEQPWPIAGIPRFEPVGENRFDLMVRSFVEAGVLFTFDARQQLPRDLPQDLTGYRAILIDMARRTEFAAPALRQRLRAFEAAGGKVITCYIPGDSLDLMDYVRTLATDAGLTLNHPAMRAKLQAVADQALVDHWLDTLPAQGEYFQKLDPGWAWGDPVACHYFRPAWEAADYFQKPELFDTAWSMMRDGLDPAKWAGRIACGRRYALRYYEKFGDEQVLQRCLREVDHHMQILERLSSDSTGDDVAPLEETPCWLNSEDFGNSGENLSYLSVVTGDERYRDACIRLFDITHRHCWDEANGLWLHRGHCDKGPIREDSGAWGRGNGWVLYGIRGLLEDMDENHPARPRLIANLQANLEGLLRWQRPSGLWTSLIDAAGQEGRDEISGTWMTMVVFARAYWKGWLRDPRIVTMCERAWQGLKTRIWRGLPVGMCLGTPRYISPACYNTSAFGGFMGAPLLLAWIELQRVIRGQQHAGDAGDASARGSAKG